MLHKYVEKNISAYFDGETGKITAYIIKNHLSSCNTCRKKIELMRAVSGLIKEKVEIDVSPGFIKNLMLKIEIDGVKTPVIKQVLSAKLIFGIGGLLILILGGIILDRNNEKIGKEKFGTRASQTKAEIVYSGTGVEYSTVSNQTRR